MRLKTVELSAKVPADSGPVHTISQAEACEWFNCSDRTLRLWADKGLPTVTREQSRTVYPVPAALVWVNAYQGLTMRNPRRRAPAWLSAEIAVDTDVARQFELWPDDFILVPLDWNHPLREDQLRRAAAGREPTPEGDTACLCRPRISASAFR